jgi:hypothetical protein
VRWPFRVCGTTTSSPTSDGERNSKASFVLPSEKSRGDQAWFKISTRARARERQRAGGWSPVVRDTPIREFMATDSASSRTISRRSARSRSIALQFGRNLELVVTDNHSYR